MRCILGLSVVLAVGISAWSAEQVGVASASEYQTAATSPVIQQSGAPALPATSPAGAYAAGTMQPAPTTMSPAPTMMFPRYYTVGTQPVGSYAAPMTTAPYTTYYYPTRAAGTMYRTTSPTYSYSSVPVATAFGEPVPGYAIRPAQTYYYRPARRLFGFGLFQRWRQQAMPAYSTMPGSGTPVYSTTGVPTTAYPAPVYTTYTNTAPRLFGLGLFQRWRQQAMPAYNAVPSYGTPAYSTTGVPATAYAAPVYITYGDTARLYYPTTYTLPAGTIPAGNLMGTITPAGTSSPIASPVYTPTMLNVPNRAAATGAAPAGTAPGETPLEGATPATTAPSQPGSAPGAGNVPPPPPVRRPAGTSIRDVPR
jgi:hypothetical protein